MVFTTQSPVVSIVSNSKRQLLEAERSQMQQMARRYIAYQDTLDPYFTLVGQEVEQRRIARKPVSPSGLLLLDSYKKMRRAAKEETLAYNAYAETTITAKQKQWVTLAQLHSQDALNAYIPQNPTQQPVNFFDPKVQEEFAGMAGDGNPLGDLLRTTWPDSADKIEELMKEALAKGFGPVETARLLRNEFFVPLNRALNIARTEQLRAYRNASLFGYKSSGIVRGYKRLATHDDRVCAGCLFKEGEFVQSLDFFDEHPQGRCTMIPVVNGVRPPDWQGNEEWFATIPEEQQLLILGPGKYDLWKSGRIELSDIPLKRHDPVWGDSWVPKPLHMLMNLA